MFLKIFRCLDTGEVAVGYAEYLKTEHWKNLKIRYKESGLCKNDCYICGVKGNLHLHHKSYKRVGQENLHDLIQLCPGCHEKLHSSLPKKYNNTQLWNSSRKLRKKHEKISKHQKVKKELKPKTKKNQSTKELIKWFAAAVDKFEKNQNKKTQNG